MAAGGLVRNENNEFLFIYRLNQLDLPKGKLEDGESEAEGALREVEEETGVQQITLGPKIIDTFHTYALGNGIALKRTAWYAMSVLGTPDLIPQVEEGITWVKWMNKQVIESGIKDTYPSIRLVWEKAMGH